MPSTASSTTVAPSPRSGSALASAARDVDALLLQEAPHCPAAGACRRSVPTTPLPDGESKSATGASSTLRSRAAARIAVAMGCSLPRSRLAASRSTSASASAPSGTIGGDGRVAHGQRAGLVDHQRVDLLQPLQRLGVADQDAGGGAAADADHDRHRRGQAQRAGAGDDQHRDGGQQGEGEARLGPPDEPGGEGGRARSPRPAARTSSTRCRPAAGSARGCAAPRPPS